MSANHAYREIAGLTKYLKVLLGLGVAIAAISLFSSFMQVELLSRGSFSEAEGQANDSREQVIGLVHLTLYLLTVVVFGRWIVRANRNVRAIGAGALRMTPGWALGYFFVPVVNLWRPYQAMKDLWEASHNPTGGSRVGEGSILPAWWTLWLLTNLANQISFRALRYAEGIEGLQRATYVQIVAVAVDIPLCLVAMTLVSRISQGQKAHMESATFD